MLFVASCGGDDYDDTALRNELTDLANRVAKLEQLCQQMNTNISSLQTIVNALQQNDFVTAVVPVTQGGKVIGYTITFSRSGAITIYHGTDGKNGENGKDGSTPQIGVKKDSDGIYYWTLNGEWLLDADGNKIQAEGKDGADGANGSSGVDGITPQLKIEEGYWYISYDNGSTWTQLGKAVGEDGADGNDGNNFFLDVQQDDEFVYFYLADGTMITLPKHDKENIQFEDLNVKAICCKNWDTNNDGELSYAEAESIVDIGTIFSQNDRIITFKELKYFTSLVELPDNAFLECAQLWKIELPKSIKKIGSSAFQGCILLSLINIHEGVSEIGNSAFMYCENLRHANIPSSVLVIQPRLFYACRKLCVVDLKEGIQSIGSYAFSGCRDLNNIYLPSSVINIDEGAFSECYSLEAIEIPQQITIINSSTFSNCKTLQNVKFPSLLTSIERGAFSGCESLDQIILPKSVRIVHDHAFSNCDIATFTLGPNISSIGMSAIDSYNVYCLNENPPQIYNSSFTANNLKIFVPEDSYNRYRNVGSYGDSIMVNLLSQTVWYRYKEYLVPYRF